MEIQDQVLIDFVVNSGPIPSAPRKAAHRPRTALAKLPAATRKASNRCTCQVCAICIDNARWERIFQEKFADPDYYSPPLRRDSCLKF